MSIPINSRCIQCTLDRNIQTLREMGCDEAAVTAFARELMQLILEVAPEDPTLCAVPGISDLFSKYTGCPEDRFWEEKQESNRFFLARMDQIRSAVESAPDPVYAGLQYAILGNYIDFSALHGEVDLDKLDGLLAKGREIAVDEAAYRQFLGDLEAGKTLLYLTDNAGEIGFDRIFAEQLQKAYPHLAITFCVKGGPANNDAMRQDAIDVGVPFPVIDNGNRTPGTQLNLCNEETLQAIAESDVIFSKGQANVETLLGCGHNIYYAFLVKCQIFIDLFRQPKLTPMLVRERSFGK